MTLEEAQNLVSGDMVVNCEGTTYKFIELDEDNDLVVECRAAMNGRIYLHREQIEIA